MFTLDPPLPPPFCPIMSSGTSWGNSTGFGAAGTAQPASQTTGGLFGNSNSALPSFAKPAGGSLSGNNQANTASSGLFGNSSTTSSGGLFGKPAAPANSAPSGLFGASGSSNNTNNTTSGLFGNSAAANTSTGLFGAANTNANTNAGSGAALGGLFGAANNSNTGTGTTGGLFGNSSTASGGLFGNSAKPSAPGLFGSTGSSAAAPAAGASNTASSGLFANANTGGMFGNSNTSGGMFGASKPAAPGGLFGGSNTAAAAPISANSSNPYSSNSVLSSITMTESNMPLSITGSLFAKSATPSHRRQSSTSLTKKPQLSLLQKLALTFKIFHSSESSVLDSTASRLKGIFTQQNFVRDLSKAPTMASNGISKNRKPTFNLPIDNANVGDVKKLVIKSKPLKFHLINADKVFNAKRRRILVLSINGGIAARSAMEEDSESEDYDLVDQERRKVAEDVSKREIETAEVEEPKLDDINLNNGYWCSPSLEVLSQLSPIELTRVDNFIVGKEDVGQIAYNYPVDLSGLFARCEQNDVPVSTELFGKIVKIEGSIVRVYSEEEDGNSKPGIGFELNVPATITIKVPPKKNVSEQAHIKRLQNLIGMEFVTYNPLTHYWTFKVKHFSVWGLIEDSDDDDSLSEEAKKLRNIKKQQDTHEKEASATYSRIYENEAYKRELKKQRMRKSTSGLPGAWNHTTSLSAGGLLGVKQGLVQNEIDQELLEYTQDKSSGAWAVNLSDITLESEESDDAKSLNSLALETPLYPEEVKNLEYLKQIVSVMPPNTNMNDIVDEKAYEPDVSDDAAFDMFAQQSDLPTSKDWLLQLKLANDIDSALTPYLTIPRKELLILTVVKDIVFSDSETSKESIKEVSTPKKTANVPLLLLHSSAFDSTNLTKLVQKLLIRSTVKSRENSYPLLQLDKSLNFEALASLNGNDSDLQFIELASILFDEVNIGALSKYSAANLSNPAVIEHLNIIEQRKSFVAWLKKYQFDSQLITEGDSLDVIFKRVCQGDLKSAIELAVSSHNTHLSTLLTLIDSNDQAVRKIAQSQIDDWNNNGATGLIPVPILKIYKLLAGLFEDVTVDLAYANAICVRLSYGNPAEKLLDVLSAVKNQGSLGAFSSIIEIFTVFKSNGMIEAAKVIEKSALSDKLKWFFMQVLTKQDDSVLSANDTIGNSFAKSLESAGLWKEAIFIYSSVMNDSSVEDLIRRVIISSIGQIKSADEDNEEFAVSVLGVPRSIIYEAIALEKSKAGDYWGEAEALTQARLWEKAHQVICKELGPAAVIDNDEETLRNLKALAKSFPQGGDIIPNWNQGAGMYIKYFELLDSFENQDSIVPDSLNFLLCNLALVQADSFTSQVALKIMVKRIGDIALEHRDDVPDVKKKILALFLGENEKNYFENRMDGLQIR